MSLEICCYDPDHLDGLTTAYNAFTAGVPHCYDVESPELGAALAGDLDSDEDRHRLSSQTVGIAVDEGVIGFVHVGDRADVTEHHHGVIRFLCYPRGRRDVGQALLDWAEAWLRERQVRSVKAYHQSWRYPFYGFAHTYLSSRCDHLQALLLFNGYVISGGEIVFDWPNFDPSRPAPHELEIKILVEEKPARGPLADLTLNARIGDQAVGQCEHLSGSTFSGRSEAGKWAFCNWLGIQDDYQGRGLGRYLLRLAQVELRRMGYLHASISTATHNHRAFLFYSNHGYTAVDWTPGFERQLP